MFVWFWNNGEPHILKGCTYHLVLNSKKNASTIKFDIDKICRLLQNAGTLVLIGFNAYNSFLAVCDGICHCLTTWTPRYQPETQHICHSFFSSWCFPDCCSRSLLRGIGRVIMHTFFMSICCYGISINLLTSYHIAEWKSLLLPRCCNMWKIEFCLVFIFFLWYKDDFFLEIKQEILL